MIFRYAVALYLPSALCCAIRPTDPPLRVAVVQGFKERYQLTGERYTRDVLKSSCAVHFLQKKFIRSSQFFDRGLVGCTASRLSSQAPRCDRSRNSRAVGSKCLRPWPRRSTFCPLARRGVSEGQFLCAPTRSFRKCSLDGSESQARMYIKTSSTVLICCTLRMYTP